MRHLLTFALILLFAGTAIAADLGTTAPPKSDTHVMQNPASDSRQGGETVETAVPFSALPFYDTGATCDNIDDYDEACPYTGSTAPDVVYAFSPAASGYVDIDLFGSTYDTKVFVYVDVVTPGAPYACNDDFYADYVSKIEFMPVDMGFTYYIVIDGWSGDCGAYELNVTEAIVEELCPIVCDGMAEGEPDNGPAYVDNYNGGCNSDPILPPQELLADGAGNLTFCGVGGWNGAGTKDTDWYMVTIGATGSATVVIETQSECWFFTLLTECPSAVLLDWTIPACEPFTVVLEGFPGEVKWLWMGSSSYDPPGGFVGYNFDYSLTFTGLQEGPVATDTGSWGSIKSMYR